jgi:hypothetical protein
MTDANTIVFRPHFSPHMEPEILDLTAVDESVMQPQNPSNVYEVRVEPNSIGTIRLMVPIVRSVYSFFLNAHVLFRP